MAQEAVTAHERRIAELEHERDRRIAELIDDAEKRAEKRRERIEDSLDDIEQWTEEEFDIIKDEARNWTWALGVACEMYAETSREWEQRRGSVSCRPCAACAPRLPKTPSRLKGPGLRGDTAR
jgi:hypothetical protein